MGRFSEWHRISRSELYDHKRPKKNPEVAEEGPLCPMTRKTCLGEACLFWDEDYNVCSMNPASLYNQIRDAVTDAAVEVMKAYGDDLR